MTEGGFVENIRRVAAKGSMLGLMFIATACGKPPSDFGPTLTRTHEVVDQLNPNSPVPSEVLENTFRTYIHNLPDVQLQIMPQALIDDPVFRQTRDNSGKELHIVLMDGSYIDPRFLPADIPAEDRFAIEEKFGQARSFEIYKSRKRFDLSRQWWKDNYDKDITEIESPDQSHSYSEEDKKEMKRLLGLYYAPYLGTPSEEDLLGDTKGQYMPIQRSQKKTTSSSPPEKAHATLHSANILHYVIHMALPKKKKKG